MVKVFAGSAQLEMKLPPKLIKKQFAHCKWVTQFDQMDLDSPCLPTDRWGDKSVSCTSRYLENALLWQKFTKLYFFFMV